MVIVRELIEAEERGRPGAKPGTESSRLPSQVAEIPHSKVRRRCGCAALSLQTHETLCDARPSIRRAVDSCLRMNDGSLFRSVSFVAHGRPDGLPADILQRALTGSSPVLAMVGAAAGDAR